MAGIEPFERKGLADKDGNLFSVPTVVCWIDCKRKRLNGSIQSVVVTFVSFGWIRAWTRLYFLVARTRVTS